MNLLEIEKISFSYGEKMILRDFSLKLGKGERICLSGVSGSGKTTLFRLISGLEKPDSGRISLNGNIACLFQEDRLLPWYTAEGNLTLFGATPERASELLSSLGIPLEDQKKFPRELSGGMNRRVAIARTIITGGEILLLDEPFSGLDEATRKRAADVLMKAFQSAAVIMITHIPEESTLIGAEIVNFVPDGRGK